MRVLTLPSRPAALFTIITIVVLAVATLVHMPLALAATTWNVTPGSACTLADAILANNTSATSGSCAAGSGSTGTINLAAGTYTLGANLPAISNNNLNIVGAGVGSTIIDGQSLYTVFTDGAGNLSGVSNLTIEHAGNGGSGIGTALFAEASTVTINNVVVENSTVAAGIDIRASNATITNVAIFNNSANAFALRLAYTNGTYTVTNATIYSNRNGVYIDANGSGTGNITNATIASNTGGGIDFHIGGGSPTVNVKNTILASNGANCAESAVTSQGHNIDSGSTCGFVGTSNHSSTNPALGSLTALGGTFVLPIDYNSPAYDQGDATGAPSTDQRGVARPQCSGVDIGAYETTTCTPAPPASGGSGGTSGGSSKSSSTKTGAASSTTPAATDPTADPTSSKPGDTTASDGSNKSAKTDKTTAAATTKAASHAGLMWGVGLVLLVALGGGGWFWLSKNPKLRAKLHL
jgi:hypothetical protein